MLKDADPRYFAGVYIVCGFTDLRYGIDSLSSIIERRFRKQLFVPNTLFLFCGRSASKIKGLLWEGDGFLLLYKRVECGRFVWPRTSQELRQLSPEQFKCKSQAVFSDEGVRMFSWTDYATNPNCLRYAIGLNPPSDILIRFSAYQ